MRIATGQREVARLLRAPEGVRETLAEVGDPEGRTLAPWVRGDARAAAALRLEVYANAVFHRIREALAAEFGALARAIGGAAFHDLATAYLIVHPSRRPSLRDAGAALPDFLADHALAGPFRRRWPWAPDLARLERALSLAFDAADAPALGREDLGARAPAEWDGLVLRFRPGVRLLRLDWPVDRLLAAPASAPSAAPAPTALLVWRRGERPHRRSLGALEASLLERALAGHPFGALCGHAARSLGCAAAPGHLAGLLAHWVDAGLLGTSGSGAGRRRAAGPVASR